MKPASRDLLCATAIFVGRGRPDLTRQCLQSFQASAPRPSRTIFVVNDDPEVLNAVRQYAGVEIIDNRSNVDFWPGVNQALAQVPVTEPFFYFGQDVVFARDWLSTASAYFQEKFPRGLGLLSLRDDLQNGFNASHGMTTRQWLYVVWGEYIAPPEYKHFFCDSELSQRSKDLRRFAYCSASHVHHAHDPSGFDGHRYDELIASEKTIETRRYETWVAVEASQAWHRLLLLERGG